MPRYFPSLLSSYAYLRELPGTVEVLKTWPKDVMIDSGAFTVFFGNVKRATHRQPRLDFSVEQYTEWVLEHREWMWNCVMLDVLGDKQATNRNLDYMVKAGLSPMPVIVHEQDVAIAKEFVQINPHVCIAGSQAYGEKAYARRVLAAKKIAPEIQPHGLAFVNWQYIFGLPLYSVDSSSWSSGARFGRMAYYSARTGLGDIKPADLDSNHARYLASCGISAQMMRAPKMMRGRVSIPRLVTAHAYLRYCEHVESTGRQLFLAVSGNGDLKVIRSVARASTGPTFDYWAARKELREE